MEKKNDCRQRGKTGLCNIGKNDLEIACDYLKRERLGNENVSSK